MYSYHKIAKQIIIMYSYHKIANQIIIMHVKIAIQIIIMHVKISQKSQCKSLVCKVSMELQ